MEAFHIFNCCTGYEGANIRICDVMLLVSQILELDKEGFDFRFFKIKLQFLELFDKGMAARQLAKGQGIGLDTDQLWCNDFVGKRVFKDTVLVPPTTALFLGMGSPEKRETISEVLMVSLRTMGLWTW